MASGTSSSADDWATMAELLNDIKSQPLTASAPIPDATPVRVQIICTQAYTRGKQAANHPEIEGPKIPNVLDENQQLVLMTYFSLGMEMGLGPKETVTSHSSPEGKKPDEFQGNRSDFKSFVTQLALCFGANSGKFGTDKAKISFAASFLRGPAFDWLEPFIDDLTGEVTFKSYTEFLDGLKAGFADPDQYATAEREIETLTQTASCSAYYSKFVTLIAQLGWTEDAVKIHYFRRGLKEEIKDLLVGRNLPNLITEFASLCIRLDNQIEARAREKKIPRSEAQRLSSTVPPQFLKSSQPPISVEQYKAPVSYSVPSHITGDPMELDSASRQAYRRANNLCTYCGASGHWVKNCQKLKSKNKIATATTGSDKNTNEGNSVLYQSKN